MARTRTHKETTVAALTAALTGARGIAFARLAKHSVKDDAQLRRLARDQGVALTVVKKTLLARAASATGLPVDTAGLSGTSVLATSADDEVAPAKLLFDFAKTHAGTRLVAALAGGAWLSEVDSARLARLPSILGLRAMLAGVLSAPMRGFATVLTRRAETLPTSAS